MSEDASPVVTGIGEVLWDLFPTGKQLGGAPANFAYHAQQLGGRSYVVSAVGRDALGDEILARLRSAGLDTRYVTVDEQHSTGTVSVKVDAEGLPSYVIHEPVAWDFIPRSEESNKLAETADIVCFGSLAQRCPVSRVQIKDFLLANAAAKRDALRVCDINLRQEYFDEPVLSASIHLANVLKMNDQEVPLVGKTCDYPTGEVELVEMLLENLPYRVIAITRGARGSTLYTRERTSHHPGYAVPKLADTVGAGDAFTAALAMGMCRGHDLDRINADANRLAAYVCSQPGAMPPIPAELRSAR